jgi:hypothetical protein
MQLATMKDPDAPYTDTSDLVVWNRCTLSYRVLHRSIKNLVCMNILDKGRDVFTHRHQMTLILAKTLICEPQS